MKKFVIKHALEATNQYSLLNRKDEEVGIVKRSTLDTFEEQTAFRYRVKSNGIDATIGVMKDSLHSLWATTYIFEYQGVRYFFEDNVGEQSFQFRIEGTINEDHISVEINWEDELEIERNEQLVATIRASRDKKRTLYHFSNSIEQDEPIFAFAILVPFMYVLHQKERNVEEDMVSDDYLN